jgi:hypothetical protein
MDQSLMEVTTRQREMKQVESQGIDTRARRDTVVLVKERSSELGGRDEDNEHMAVCSPL